MGWYNKGQKKVTLEPVGFPDLWVEFKPLGAMNYKQAKDFQKKLGAVKAKMDEAVDSESDGVDALEQGETATGILFAEAIVNWNIPPSDSNIGDPPLKLPKEDLAVIAEIPLDVLNWIAEQIQGETATVPNESGT